MARYMTILCMVLVLCSAVRVPTVAAAAAADELSAQTQAALASDDYLTVAMALFSAASQADIDALDSHFQTLLARELLHPTTRIAARPPSLTQQLVKQVTADPTYRNRITARALRSLQPGDILLRRTHASGCTHTEIVPGCRRWAVVYDSAALFVGNNGGVASVYTATPTGGVRVTNLGGWLRAGYYVAIYRPSARYRAAHGISAFISAYGTTGQTGYNRTQTDKTDDTQLSSAQLVWQYYARRGLDLDSNNPLFAHWLQNGYSPLVCDYIASHAVAPDELALSPLLTRVAAGRVP